jgi:hypothetical protein
VYVGNYEYDADEQELEKSLNKYGRVRSMEYKSGARPATAAALPARRPPPTRARDACLLRRTPSRHIP